jgi:regulator of PEP synthase PpsR (kinase-PPPase family)
MVTSANIFHLHLVSDATGETLLTAARAAASQYRDARVIEHLHPSVRSIKQLQAVMRAIETNPGITLHTILDEGIAAQLDAHCRNLGLPSVSVLEPVISVFQSYLGKPKDRRIAAQHALDGDYFRRIDALNFTMEHDDGQLPGDIDDADIVLVGISRTSKTPTSIYLANRGYRTINVPIVAGRELPPALIAATKPLIVGLVASADRIASVRQNRPLGEAGDYDGADYVNRATIVTELTHARRIFARHNWPVIDVTRRSIEETAAAILALKTGNA